MTRISTRERPYAIAYLSSRLTRLRYNALSFFNFDFLTCLSRMTYSQSEIGAEPAPKPRASIRTLASALAATMTQSTWLEPEISQRSVDLLGKQRPWIEALVKRVLVHYPSRPQQRRLAAFILQDQGFVKACSKYNLIIKQWPVEPTLFSPLAFAADLDLPKLAKIDELADWLGVAIRHLVWYADCRGLCSKSDNPRLMHYHFRILHKRFGSVRLIEAPKRRIKSLQRLILDGILGHIPTHPAAQGFRIGTSICTFATPHVNQRVLLKLDLQDFFPSISYARVNAVFRSVGYPECVAELLAGICTNTAPTKIWEELNQFRDVQAKSESLLQAIHRYSKPHLPQGAPTSPALANLCAFKLDCRLAALARTAGATYTRYADDLAFSGPDEFRRSVRSFSALASSIVLEEGFRVNFRKTRIMPSGVKQKLAGLVINSHLNVSRRDFDELKAILTNCLRSGPASQNRAAHCNFRHHLLGRISFIAMVSPSRGQKLRAIFDRIQW